MKEFIKKYNLLIWVASAILLSLASLVLVRVDSYVYRSSTPALIGKKLVPSLNIDKVYKISLESLEERIIIQKKQGIWKVKSLFGYIADIELVNKLLDKLYSSRIVQSVSAGSGQLADLNLEPPKKNEGDSGIQISLYSKSNKLLSKLILGKIRAENLPSVNRKINLGTYVFSDYYNSPLLTDSIFTEIDIKQGDWLNKSFPKINKLKSIELFEQGRQIWKIIKKDRASKFTIEDRNIDISGTEPNGVERMISSISTLQFLSVAGKKNSMNQMGFSSGKIVKFTGFDGSLLILYIGDKKDKKYFVKVRYIHDGKTVKEPVDFSRWVYLIDSKRIAPFLVEKGELTKKLLKARDTKFSMPIG